ncbi:MAG: imidazolonepropionase-like amidohydrolase [Chlamydiales bacterium]|jgi:imidazolonepropionase-like amidohydrolase
MMSFFKGTGALCALVCALQPAVRADGNDHPFELDAQRVPSIELDGACFIENATIHDAIGPAFVGDVHVEGGKIVAVGDLEAPAGVTLIDGTGMHLAPGVVDCHSHIAIEGGVNEGTVTISADVSIEDVVRADDLGIYRALAGGVTTARLLHGSANAIGGRHEVIKLKWGRTADELRFPGAPRGIKFALGENPKRSNGRRRSERFPGTRMGVEAVFYRAFERAREYRTEWRDYETRKAVGDDAAPPRRDIRLEALVGILDGEIAVHSHCYRMDEILMLIRASQHFGFGIATLQHVLEGYKVAYEMAEAGVGGSTFSDWWAYKVEAYDAIPHNAALMMDAGVLTSINSDSGEMIRRLYQEAAKSVRYAGMDRVQALKLVTLNPALQLGIGDRVGSIEVGKDADLTLLNADPLSVFSRVEWTMVDGRIEFERIDAFDLDSSPLAVSAVEDAPRSRDALDGNAPVLALVGGTLHPVTAPAIPGGTLLVQDGHILALGSDVAVPAGTEVIDVAGLDVWPGMISLQSRAGIHEIGAVAATNDVSEIGGNQPDLRVTASINADSAHIGVTRQNGITRAQTTPSGDLIRGQSAVVRLLGDTWEEMLLVDRDMLHIGFPRVRNDADDKDEGDDRKALAKLFTEAREYGRVCAEAHEQGLAAPPYDPRLSALAPFARGEKPVGIEASNAQTILYALRFIGELELDAVIYGASEAWKVVDALASAQVPVVLGPIWSVPRSPYDPYDASFANAAVLHRAGVPFAIMTKDQDNERNLPFQAGTAAAHGLPREEAVRAVTLYPARILGVDDRLGSLTVGKIADIVVTRGSLLEIASPVELLLIDGQRIDPRDNRQERFHDRYRDRLRSKMNAGDASAPAVEAGHQETSR